MCCLILIYCVCVLQDHKHELCVRTLTLIPITCLYVLQTNLFQPECLLILSESKCLNSGQKLDHACFFFFATQAHRCCAALQPLAPCGPVAGLKKSCWLASSLHLSRILEYKSVPVCKCILLCKNELPLMFGGPSLWMLLDYVKSVCISLIFHVC